MGDNGTLPWHKAAPTLAFLSGHAETRPMGYAGSVYEEVGGIRQLGLPVLWWCWNL